MWWVIQTRHFFWRHLRLAGGAAPAKTEALPLSGCRSNQVLEELCEVARVERGVRLGLTKGDAVWITRRGISDEPV
jgi:hypothetical protein